MASSPSAADPLIGYLMVVEPREAVFIGGLLVTTMRGRPLEFHCTAPVAPNPTQTLLFGPTLRTYLCGEVIGGALLKKAAAKPSLVLVEDAACLDVRELVGCPVAVVYDDDRNAAARPDIPADAFVIGPLTLGVQPGYLEDVGQIRSLGLDEDADLAEPLERVREAIGQTLRADAA